MFALVSDKLFGNRRMLCNDIDTLGDIALGITGKETDYVKVTHIAGEMNFGDAFITENYAIYCFEDN